MLIIGNDPGPYSLHEGGGIVVASNAAEAIAASSQTDFNNRLPAQPAVPPTFVTWTAALATFQGTTPTVGALNSWLAAHPPTPD
jgi:hypothetical protein